MDIYITSMQAASFNYEMLYKVARAISNEVRAKVAIKINQHSKLCGYYNYYIIILY